MKTKKFIGILVAVSMLGLNYVSTSVRASTDSWQKGISIEPSSATDFSSDNFKQSLQNAVLMDANWLTLIIPYYQSTLNSSDIAAGWNTPTDASLIDAINYAHGLGLHVNLKPHLQVSSDPTAWRANINASDRNAWYAAYENMITHYATIAQTNHVEEITIGTELIDMASSWMTSDNTARWDTMIAGLRSIYSGSLTYSANWGSSGWYDEKSFIKFWDKLDFIGVSAYVPLSTNPNYSISDLKNSWANWDTSSIKPLVDTYHKPVVFTEVGYRSMDGSVARPSHWQSDNAVDLQEQVDAYQSLFEYWSQIPYFQGLQIWEWSSNPAAGGTNDNGYTPQQKPAENLIREWFGQNPPQPSSVSFESSATASGNFNENQPITFTATIQNTGPAVSGTIVDLEIRDSLNTKTNQQFFDNQSFAVGETKTYTVSWTPAGAGSYRMTAGVFNQNWSTVYHWNDQAFLFSVSQSSTTPTPIPTVNSMDIWWPTNGTTVTGIQPFKGLVENQDLSTYNMYWQVDGDRLNIMGDSNVDWPHKEANVDLSGWNWNDQGLYHLNFIAKDLGGTTISQRSVDIYTK